MREPLISVIIPVYNVEDYLDRTLKSVIEQTYRNIEIILVDDGSTDSSLRKCKEWRQIDSRIVVVSRENGGAAAARNTGLSVCRGCYVMFVDSDDVVSDNICEVLYKSLSSTHADISIARMQKHEKNGNLHATREWLFDDPIKVMKDYNCLKCLLLDQLDCGPCHKLFYADKAQSIRFPEGVINEDLVFLYKYLMTIKTAVLVKDILYTYEFRENSVTSAAFSMKTFDRYHNSLEMRIEVSKEIPILRNEASFYFWRQSFYILKEMIERDVIADYLDMWNQIRNSIKHDLGKILLSQYISNKEKLAYFVIVYFPYIYIWKYGRIKDGE